VRTPIFKASSDSCCACAIEVQAARANDTAEYFQNLRFMFVSLCSSSSPSLQPCVSKVRSHRIELQWERPCQQNTSTYWKPTFVLGKPGVDGFGMQGISLCQSVAAASAHTSIYPA